MYRRRKTKPFLDQLGIENHSKEGSHNVKKTISHGLTTGHQSGSEIFRYKRCTWEAIVYVARQKEVTAVMM